MLHGKTLISPFDDREFVLYPRLFWGQLILIGEVMIASEDSFGSPFLIII